MFHVIYVVFVFYFDILNWLFLFFAFSILILILFLYLNFHLKSSKFLKLAFYPAWEKSKVYEKSIFLLPYVKN